MHVYRKVFYLKQQKRYWVWKKNGRDLCRKVSFMSRCNMPSKFSGENTVSTSITLEKNNLNDLYVNLNFSSAMLADKKIFKDISHINTRQKSFPYCGPS